jgi:uncharacterized glyoxalase superfamily protein PhnB
MSVQTSVGVWVSLTYRDADAAMSWFKAVGFTENAVYRDENDPSEVSHAEYLWPGGGGIMFGTYRERPTWPKQPGTGAAYVVTDDVDGVYAAALAAGASSLDEPHDEPYGRSAAVADPEGNIWSFGNYQGE